MVRIFLARQPILDREGRIFAYELLFRSRHTDTARIEDGKKATARVIESLISSFGLRNVIRDRIGFINIDESSDILKVVEILPPERIGFEVLETSVLSEEFFRTLERLKSLGYRLSLDDFVYDERFIPFLNLVDYVKIDVLNCTDEAEIERVLNLIRGSGAKLVAEKVENYGMYKTCLSMGFDYFQGFFFQKPEIVASKTIEPAYAALIKLYNLIATEAGVGEIEKVFKKFSELSVKLLQLINSAYYALRQPIKSIRHAILMLGYRNILRWILILMYSVRDEEFGESLYNGCSVAHRRSYRSAYRISPGGASGGKRHKESAPQEGGFAGRSSFPRRICPEGKNGGADAPSRKIRSDRYGSASGSDGGYKDLLGAGLLGA